MDMEASHSAINGLAEVSQPTKKPAFWANYFLFFKNKITKFMNVLFEPVV